MCMLLPNYRETCLRIALLIPFSAMQHEPKGGGKHKIECPWDETPMEQREDASPFSNTSSHLSNMRVGSIHNPLGKRVEQDVGGKTAGEHHAAPCKKIVLWLFIRFPKNNLTILGEGKENGKN